MAFRAGQSSQEHCEELHFPNFSANYCSFKGTWSSSPPTGDRMVIELYGTKDLSVKYALAYRFIKESPERALRHLTSA